MRDSAITPLPLTPPQLPPTVPVRGLDPLSLHTADTKDPHKVRDLLVGHGLLKKTTSGGYDNAVEPIVTEKVNAMLDEAVPEIQQNIEQGVDEKLESYSTVEDTDAKLKEKVSKEAGKGLSSNDYTTEEKTKLAGIEEGAQKNPNLAPYAKTANVNAALETKVSRTEDNTETMGRAIIAPTDFTSQVTFATDRPRMNNRGAFLARSVDSNGEEYSLTASTMISVMDEYMNPTGETLELGEVFTDGALQAIGSALGNMDPSYGINFEPGQINFSLGWHEFSVMLWDDETSDYTKEWSRKVTAESAYVTNFAVSEYEDRNHYTITIPLYTSDTYEYFGDLYMVDLAYSYGVINAGELEGAIQFYNGTVDTSYSGFTDPELEEVYYDIKLSIPEEIQFYASVDPDPYDPYMGHINPVNMGAFRTDTDEIDASEIKSGELALERLPTIPESKLSNLSAGKISSGTFNAARIPNLPASKITSGVFPYAQAPQELQVKSVAISAAGDRVEMRSGGIYKLYSNPSYTGTIFLGKLYMRGLVNGGRATVLVPKELKELCSTATNALTAPTLERIFGITSDANIRSNLVLLGDSLDISANPIPAGIYEIFTLAHNYVDTPATGNEDTSNTTFIIRFTASPTE